jgi:hypothetical protein
MITAYWAISAAIFAGFMLAWRPERLLMAFTVWAVFSFAWFVTVFMLDPVPGEPACPLGQHIDILTNECVYD